MYDMRWVLPVRRVLRRLRAPPAAVSAATASSTATGGAPSRGRRRLHATHVCKQSIGMRTANGHLPTLQAPSEGRLAQMQPSTGDRVTDPALTWSRGAPMGCAPSARPRRRPRWSRRRPRPRCLAAAGSPPAQHCGIVEILETKAARQCDVFAAVVLEDSTPLAWQPCSRR